MGRARATSDDDDVVVCGCAACLPACLPSHWDGWGGGLVLVLVQLEIDIIKPTFNMKYPLSLSHKLYSECHSVTVDDSIFVSLLTHCWSDERGEVR